jgi:putative flippase GtrA
MNVTDKFLNREFLTYLFVGGVIFLFYMVFIILAVETFHFDYRLGVSGAYLLAVIFHFFANRTFTFRSVGHRLVDQSIRYIGLLIFNYFITLMVVSFCVEKLSFSPSLSAALAIVFTVGLGYLASKFWVFRKSESLHD